MVYRKSTGRFEFTSPSVNKIIRVCPGNTIVTNIENPIDDMHKYIKIDLTEVDEDPSEGFEYVVYYSNDVNVLYEDNYIVCRYTVDE